MFKLGQKQILKISKGESNIESVFKGTTQVFTPEILPPTLSLVSVSLTTVTLEVLNNNKEELKEIEINYADSTFTQDNLSIKFNESQTFTITNLPVNTNFNFVAVAKTNLPNFSKNSNTINVSTLELQAPEIEVLFVSPSVAGLRLINNNPATVTLYYETDGSDPTTSSPEFSLSLRVNDISVSGLTPDSLIVFRGLYFFANVETEITEIQFNTTTPRPSPGPETLVAGNLEAGFFGQATQIQFGRTMTQIMSDLGITEGTAQNTVDGLLKFIHRGKIKFINRRSIRNTITWNHIQQRLEANGGNVYGGATMTFGGYSYKVRLMRGWGQVSANTDGTGTPNYETGPLMTIDFGAAGNNGANWPTNTSGWSVMNPNEWNTLIFPIASASQTQTSDVPNWASFSNANLSIGGSGGGRATWTQETRNTNTSLRVSRGNSALASVFSGTGGFGNLFGLRLVFELI